MRNSLLDRLVSLVGECAPGTVSLVGAGPGDSTLVTVRGAVRLSQADVVLHDKLVGPELLDLIPAGAERIFVGKWRGEHPWTQEQINAALIEHARAGRRVVRLKGGDPFVFGRGGEECEALAAAGIAFEVVPGITAAFGAPAYAGIPLTHRGLSRSFALVTGHEDPDAGQSLDFDALARIDTLAMYMGVRHLAGNCRRLMAAGLPPTTPAAVIEWGTRPAQRVITGTVADVAQRADRHQVRPPALVLIGKVVSVRERIQWFENQPLHGQVIVVTRMRDQAAALTGPLRAAGADVIEAPTLTLAPMPDYAAVDESLRTVGTYAWLVVTSANGAGALFDRLDALGLDARALAGVKIAAVGSATAGRLGEGGIRPDLVPPEATGESLGRAMIAAGVGGGQRVLLLRGDLADESLPAALRAGGAHCDDRAVYRTIAPADLPDAFWAAYEAGRIGWITLTSPSAFVNLLERLGGDRTEQLRAIKLASIGPVTTRAIRERGFEVTVEADPHDVAGMVAAIVREVRHET